MTPTEVAMFWISVAILAGLLAMLIAAFVNAISYLIGQVARLVGWQERSVDDE
ncbi:MAG: hypothetical protein GTO63_11445 [Anaerolineae bacterium]|nr:hypothetical protein [Anaerolineae bacterium]